MIAGVKVNAQSDHLFKNRCGRQNVNHPVLSTPTNVARQFVLSVNRNGAILVVAKIPIGFGRFVKQKASEWLQVSRQFEGRVHLRKIGGKGMNQWILQHTS